MKDKRKRVKKEKRGLIPHPAKYNALDFLTVDQALYLLPFTSRTTLYKLREAGEIPYYKMGHKVLFKQADIYAYIDRQKVILKTGR